jgi:hypothetical protein
MHVDEPEEGMEEILVLRVVSAAQRRRIRRAVVGGLLVTVVAGGVAIGLTHRSGAAPRAVSTPAVGVPVGSSTRADILAVARTRYASTLDSTRGARTHLEFGRLSVIDDRATLDVNFVCVPLCGHGEQLSLAKRDGYWRVVAARQTWVS